MYMYIRRGLYLRFGGLYFRGGRRAQGLLIEILCYWHNSLNVLNLLVSVLCSELWSTSTASYIGTLAWDILRNSWRGWSRSAKSWLSRSVSVTYLSHIYKNPKHVTSSRLLPTCNVVRGTRIFSGQNPVSNSKELSCQQGLASACEISRVLTPFCDWTVQEWETCWFLFADCLTKFDCRQSRFP